jgi:glyoxylase-like metal-dependent hydrolase (beta-lactamase superfamily II)
MKVTSHGEHLLKLTRLGAINCFLVREDDGFTLVDTGLPGSGRDIAWAAEDAGGEIRRIAITHAHQDHVGSLEALHEQLPDAEVLVPEREARFLRGDKSLDPGEPQAKLRGNYVTADLEPSRLLRPGEHVGSLELVPSPGHTPGHAAYRDVRDSTLIAGDAYQTLGGIAVAGRIRPLFPLPALVTWHKPTALESARTLRELQPSRLAVGHGRVVENPTEQMDGAIAEAS